MVMSLWGIVLIAVPALAIVLLIKLSDRIRERRVVRYVWQVKLTDAIHWELGAVAAPTVERRLGGAWIVHMRLPFDRADMVASILSITDRVFASAASSGKLQVVLSRGPSSTMAPAPSSRRPRGVGSSAPLVAPAR